MARSGKKRFNRSLDLLDSAVRNTLRLGDQVGEKQGRVGALRERLQRARSELDVHRETQPLEERRSRQKADIVLLLTVEYLSELVKTQTSEKG